VHASASALYKRWHVAARPDAKEFQPPDGRNKGFRQKISRAQSLHQ
jgi:hypothetical protein